MDSPSTINEKKKNIFKIILAHPIKTLKEFLYLPKNENS